MMVNKQISMLFLVIFLANTLKSDYYERPQEKNLRLRSYDGLKGVLEKDLWKKNSSQIPKAKKPEMVLPSFVYKKNKLFQDIAELIRQHKFDTALWEIQKKYRFQLRQDCEDVLDLGLIYDLYKHKTHANTLFRNVSKEANCKEWWTKARLYTDR